MLGTGRYGQIISEKLLLLGNVIWSENSESDYKFLSVPDWVFIATPDQYHFEQAAHFLEAGANVFLEKPATIGVQALKSLIEMASVRNVHFFVSEVFRYHTIPTELGEAVAVNEFSWRKEARPGCGSLLDRLAYHHLYLICEEAQYPESVEVKEIRINDLNELDFSLEINGVLYHFDYSCNIQKPSEIKHTIFGASFSPKQNDALSSMLESVISEAVSFGENHRRAIWTTETISRLKNELFPKVGIVGGGIFGCTSAIELAARGYNVTLYERHNELLQEASSINQNRVHSGYHYPRSEETARECQSSSTRFLKAYKQAVTARKDGILHHYGISSEYSKVSATRYLEFLDAMELPYQLVDSLPGTDLTIEADEYLINPTAMLGLLRQRLLGSGVQLHLGKEANEEQLKSFDYKVVATYANSNDWAIVPRDYQFEICEKPVLKLDEEYANRSIVILDGPFMCIDPLPSTGLHVMGHVEHAIHHSNVGTVAEVPKEYANFLNRGVVRNPKITHIDEFLSSAETFFPGISRSEHVGSMFTIRTVLPNHDHDDARPTLIERSVDGYYQLFSGKICTSIWAAEMVANFIEKDRSHSFDQS